MTEDEKLRFILIVSAIVAALAVHRFVESSPASARSTGVRYFTPSGVGMDRPADRRGRVSKAKVVVIVLSAMMAALIVHGLVGDAGRADAHFLPETGVPVTEAYGR